LPRIPDDWIRIRTIDAHAEGEPLRVILDGFPQPSGATVLERRRYAMEHLDPLRRALMWEPRGHADMYGCLVMPPVTEEADVAVLFLHNDGFSTMCGHGIIGVTTTLLQTGIMPGLSEKTELGFDTPAGFITATAFGEDGHVSEVRFRNVPSFVVELDASVEVPGLGSVTYDLAFGGAFYAYANAEVLGLDLRPDNARALIDAGRAIKHAVSAVASIDHPDDPDLSFLYGTVFVGPAEEEVNHSRHVCVFADGEVDRSPTGTGVSGRLAILAAREELGPDTEIWVESIVGGRFSGRIVGETEVGPHGAVIPEVGGRAFITGRHEFLIDPRDPWKEGFLIR
jgi:trans-L-3-hydroxyproline dehydratase